jgi:hypothetical protein
MPGIIVVYILAPFGYPAVAFGSERLLPAFSRAERSLPSTVSVASFGLNGSVENEMANQENRGGRMNTTNPAEGNSTATHP